MKITIKKAKIKNQHGGSNLFPIEGINNPNTRFHYHKYLKYKIKYLRLLNASL